MSSPLHRHGGSSFVLQSLERLYNIRHDSHSEDDINTCCTHNMAPSLIRLYACIENNVRSGGPVGGVGVEVFERLKGSNCLKGFAGGDGTGWDGAVLL